MQKKVGDAAGTIAALTAQVQATVGVDQSAVVLINGFAAQINAAVQAALAGGATAAQLQPVTDAVTALTNESAALSAAVAANAPPAPSP